MVFSDESVSAKVSFFRPILSAAFALAVFTSGPAKAQDAAGLMTPAPMASWQAFQGFYVGGALGYGSGETKHSYDRNDGNHPEEVSNEVDGYAMSVTFGFNHLMSPQLLVGFEADLGFMDLDAEPRLNVWDGHIWHSSYGGAWGTMRGRAGYVWNGSTLIFGTAGLAFMQTDEYVLGDNGNADQNTYNDDVHSGLVVGLGVEHAVSERTSVKLEYLHMDFGESEGYTNNEEPFHFDNTLDMVRVGFNYMLQ